MINFTDIHIHMLSNVDDGASSPTEMRDMLDLAYQDGSRVFCLTPHFHPAYYGDNIQAVEAGYSELVDYANKKYPDVRLFLGNELHYSLNCLEWLNKGTCKTLNHTRNVLVDFPQNVDRKTIFDAVYRLLNNGYIPVVAHVERYDDLSFNCRDLLRLKGCGAYIQIDASSLFGAWGSIAKMKSRRMIKKRLVDLVCSDAHDLFRRPPQLSGAYRYVCGKCGHQYAEQLFSETPLKILEI